MARPIDRRPAMTIKGDEITPEFRAVITKAAKRAGMTQSAWVVQRLGDLARRELAGDPDEAPVPAIVPPAVIDGLRKEVDRHAAETRHEMAELREQMMATNRLVAEMGALSGTKPRGVLGRLFGKRD